MECRLSGAFALDSDDAGGGRPLSLVLRGPTLASALWERRLSVRGTLDAPAFAEGSEVAGEIVLGRVVTYRLWFTSDAGAACELCLEQELALRRPPRGFSMVQGDIRCRAQRIGRARLRLDPRTGVRGLTSDDRSPSAARHAAQVS